nr:class I tRNA ligase family protein [Pseudomonas luteola]
MNTTPNKKSYLLIPVPPTPNGRLHLGHMAGPYLRMDILRRFLLQQGHSAEIWTGTDSHDSFILHRAHLNKCEPKFVCNKYHPLIQQDLTSLNIEVSGFIDTLEGEGREIQEAHARETVDYLISQGNAYIGEELILYDINNKVPVVGTWLTGKCPFCHEECIGYFCENCFTHNQPSELVERNSRYPSGLLEEKKIETVFLSIQDPQRHIDILHSIKVKHQAIEVVAEIFKRTRAHFRLTVPIDWGLTYPNDSFSHPRSIFEVLWEVHTYSEIHAQRNKVNSPAWQTTSDINIVVACGIDNTVPILIGCVGVYDALPNAKTPVGIHINHFTNLNGHKFSTNRNHAIWASDLALALENKVDGLRLYLAKISPEEFTTDFVIDEFVEFMNIKYRSLYLEKIEQASALGTKPRWHSVWIKKLNSYIVRQKHLIEADNICLRRVVHLLDEWMSDFDVLHSESEERYWWLKGVAVLGNPIIPSISKKIFKHFGYQDIPIHIHSFEMPSFLQEKKLILDKPPFLSTDLVTSLIGRTSL